MIKLQQLSEAAKAATPGPWVARKDGWTIRAYPDERIAADGVKVAHTCGPLIKGQGMSIDIRQQVANQEFIALANPATILELCALLEKVAVLREAAVRCSALELVHELFVMADELEKS